MDQPKHKIDIERAISRGQLDLERARVARRIDEVTGEKLPDVAKEDLPFRNYLVQCAQGYFQMAAVLQEERRFEQEQIDKIKEAHGGTGHTAGEGS